MCVFSSSPAKAERPNSIRALYAFNGTANAVHGSDSMESAQRELQFWFPRPTAQTKSVTASISSHKFPEMSTYMNQIVDPVLAPIILRVG